MAKWHAKQYSSKGVRRYPKFDPVYRQFSAAGRGAVGAGMAFVNGGGVSGAYNQFWDSRKRYLNSQPKQKYKKRILSSSIRKYGTIGSNPPGPVLGSPSNRPSKGKSFGFMGWPRSKKAHIHKFSY